MSQSKDVPVILKIDEILAIDKGKFPSKKRVDASFELLEKLIRYNPEVKDSNKIKNNLETSLFYDVAPFIALHAEIQTLINTNPLSDVDKESLKIKLNKLYSMTDNLEKRLAALKNERNEKGSWFNDAFPWPSTHLDMVFSALTHVIELERGMTNELAKSVNAVVPFKPPAAPRRPVAPMRTPESIFRLELEKLSKEWNEVSRTIKSEMSTNNLEKMRESALQQLNKLVNMKSNPVHGKFSGALNLLENGMIEEIKSLDRKILLSNLEKANAAFKSVENFKKKGYFNTDDAKLLHGNIDIIKKVVSNNFAISTKNVNSGKVEPTGDFKIALDALRELERRLIKAEKCAKIFRKNAEGQVTKQIRSIVDNPATKKAFEYAMRNRDPIITVQVQKIPSK